MTERSLDPEELGQALGEALRGTSVLERIGSLTGVAPRVLLRDPPEERTPIVLKASGEESPQDDSRYQILGELAFGGVGIVYKGRDKDLGRDVALKVLRTEHVKDEGIFGRFVEEAQIGGQLQHPGIVPVYGVGLQPDGRPFFAMKLIKGETLTELLRAKAPRERLLRIFEQVAQTVGYAHSRGVIHRDVKPSNVMVGSFGEVQVVDWGFAKLLGRETKGGRGGDGLTVVSTVRSVTEGSQSLAGSVMGTPAYMPPEQALGRIDELDERSDVFALGAVLCEILTGQPPYTGATKDQLLAATQARLGDAFGRLDACDADPDLKAIVRACLEPLPKDRLANAGEVAERMYSHLSAVEERAQKAEIEALEERERAERARSSKRQTLVVAAAAVAALALLGGGYLWQRADAAARAEAAAPRVVAAMRKAVAAEGADDWEAAVAAARRAVDLAVTEGAHEDTVAEVRSGLARIEAARDEHAAVARRRAEDETLLSELEEYRASLGDEMDEKAVDAHLSEVLRRHGVALDDALAARLETSHLAADFAATFDAWALLRRTKKLEGADWETPARIARRIDPAKEHEALRDALYAKDAARLSALVAATKFEDLPKATLSNIVTVLDAAGDKAGAFRLAEEAVDLYPQDFWIQWCRSQVSVVREAAGGDPGRLRDVAAAQVGAHLAAVAIRPNSPEARHRLGCVFARIGDHERALECFRAALRLKPGWGHALGHIGQALRELGHDEEGLAALYEGRRLAPEDGWVQACLGVSLWKKGDLDGALAADREAVRLRPDDATSLMNLGVVLCEKGDHEAGLVELRRAVRLAPDDVWLRTNVAGLYLNLGRLDEVIVETRDLVRVDPRSSRAYRVLALALNRKGEHDEAVAAAREAVRLAPRQSDPFIVLAEVLQGSGDLDGAIAACREAMRMGVGPNDHYNLGCMLAKKGDQEGAIAEYREAIRENPNHAEAYCNLGSALEKELRYAESLEAYRKGHELGSARADWTYPSAEWLADAERMVALESRVPAILRGEDRAKDVDERIGFARVLEDAGHHAEAARMYEEAFAERPDVAENISEGHRYSAACCAAGASKEDASWRPKALAWLRADLDARRAQLATDPKTVAKRLAHWQEDEDLASVRDALGSLPEDAAWRALWEEVAAVLKEARAAK